MTCCKYIKEKGCPAALLWALQESTQFLEGLRMHGVRTVVLLLSGARWLKGHGTKQEYGASLLYPRLP